MNQIVKDKMLREIMVIKNDTLFSKYERKQWLLSKENNFEEVILKNFEYMVRWEAEKNFDFKQPIPYWVVVNEDKKVFVYKRWWTGSNAWESRLHSKISFWVWWHIEVSDKVTQNLLRETLLREVEEETNISNNNVKKVEVLGYINDDLEEVWKVHFWIAYAIEIKNSNISLTDWELETHEFLSIDEIDEMINSWNFDVENWSKILYPEIKKYLM